MSNLFYISFKLKEGFHIGPLFFILFLSYSCIAQNNNTLSKDLFNFNHSDLKNKTTEYTTEDQIFHKNKVTFLNIIFNESSISEQTLDTYENTISELEKIEFNQPRLKDYYIGEAQLILSLLYMKQGSQLSSARYFIKAYNTFSKNVKHYPEFKDPLVALHFMEISASILPKSLQWITSWFGLKSDQEKATQHLKHLYYSNQLSPLAKEQCYILNLYLKLQFDIQILKEQDPETFNTVASKLILSEIYGKNKMYVSMINTLLEIPDRISLKHFLLGKAYFITEHHNAKSELLHFVSHSKTKTNTSAAYYYLYQLNLLNKEDSLQNRLNTLADNKHKNYRDKWAKEEILQTPDPFLIRVRNSFDRGDYAQCITLLNTKQKHSTREVYYLTNAYILTKQITKAKTSYNTLKKMGLTNEYYVPKTGLNLAQSICRDEPEFAKSILKTLTNYKNYPYQKEIETKSEMLLKTL